MADPLAPRVEGDRLYGRGALRHEGRRWRPRSSPAATAAGRGLAGDVVVAAVADEEHASLGVQEALARGRARTRRS